MRPLIGLTTSLYEGDPSRPNRAVVNAAYIAAIEAVGGVPILLSPHHTEASTRELMNIVSGVVVSGGGDVDPARYGQSPDATCSGISALRDEYETEVIALAMERELPLLLICRGMQLFNVIRGGSLVQDIPIADIVHSQEVARHIATHSVRLTPGTKLATTLGGERVMTNSMHHQAVDRPGEGIEVVAWADDGVVEGFEMPSYPGWLLGVQWHPEELVSGDAASSNLFAEMMVAATKHEMRPKKQEVNPAIWDVRFESRLPKLFTKFAPWLFASSRSVESDILFRPPSEVPDCCVIRLDGRHIRSEAELHSAVSNAFQFPYYYGRNYHAMLDCLLDMAWCEAGHEAFVVRVQHADQMIHGALDDPLNPLRYLADVAVANGERLASEWQRGHNDVRPGVSFKFVFHAEPGEPRARLDSALRAFGHDFGTLD